MKQVLESDKSRVFSLSVGVQDRNTNYWVEEALGIEHAISSRTFPKGISQVLVGKDASSRNIINCIGEYVERASSIDTIFFFYSGHGLPDSITLPKRNGTEDYPKESLFHELSQFPGRRIAILSSCHGGYPSIPSNSLLVTPSRQETLAYGNIFFADILFELLNASHVPHALTYLINRFLTSYHNRPYGPLKGKYWEEDPDHSDLEIYEEEKRSGKATLINYQRAFVLSTLIENGDILHVDPSCYFPC